MVKIDLDLLVVKCKNCAHSHDDKAKITSITIAKFDIDKKNNPAITIGINTKAANKR